MLAHAANDAVLVSTLWNNVEAVVAVDLCDGSVVRVTSLNASWRLRACTSDHIVAESSTLTQPPCLHIGSSEDAAEATSELQWRQLLQAWEPGDAPLVADALQACEYSESVSSADDGQKGAITRDCHKWAHQCRFFWCCMCPVLVPEAVPGSDFASDLGMHCSNVATKVTAAAARLTAAPVRAVQSLVLAPKASGDRRHPAILLLHGGPHAAVANAWTPPLPLLVAAGFAVVLPNYRGSAGYGEGHLQALPGHVGRVRAQAASLAGCAY